MTSLLQKELGQLEKQLLTLTAVVEESVQKAIKALSGHDRELAPVPVHGAKHPFVSAGFMFRPREAHDLGHAGARHDQAVLGQRHQQAV